MRKLGESINELMAALAAGDDASRKAQRAAAVNVAWRNAVEAVYKDAAQMVLDHVNAVYIMAADEVVKGATTKASHTGTGAQLVVYADDSLIPLGSRCAPRVPQDEVERTRRARGDVQDPAFALRNEGSPSLPPRGRGRCRRARCARESRGNPAHAFVARRGSCSRSQRGGGGKSHGPQGAREGDTCR